LNASYQLAEQSVITLKKERYEDAIKLYESFIDYYPESVYLKKAEAIYKSLLEELGKTAPNSSS
jgi:outer membrane protein assembly factor BamD